jgi:hypothetical protein
VKLGKTRLTTGEEIYNHIQDSLEYYRNEKVLLRYGAPQLIVLPQKYNHYLLNFLEYNGKLELEGMGTLFGIRLIVSRFTDEIEIF